MLFYVFYMFLYDFYRLFYVSVFLGCFQENHENLEKHRKLKFMNMLNFLCVENFGFGIWARDHAKKMRLPPRIRMHRLSAKSELREPVL